MSNRLKLASEIYSRLITSKPTKDFASVAGYSFLAAQGFLEFHNDRLVCCDIARSIGLDDDRVVTNCVNCGDECLGTIAD